jgi:hypothetical protein
MQPEQRSAMCDELMNGAKICRVRGLEQMKCGPKYANLIFSPHLPSDPGRHLSCPPSGIHGAKESELEASIAALWLPSVESARRRRCYEPRSFVPVPKPGAKQGEGG